MKHSSKVPRPGLRAIGVYGITLLAGLLAAWAVHEHIQTREQEIERHAQGEMSVRVVADNDLASGTILNLDHLAARDVPTNWVPSDSYASDAIDQILGKRLSADVKRGELLTSSHIAAVDEPSVAARVRPGRRAVTFPAGEIQATAGLLQAGDLIDLYVSFKHQGQPVTAVLAQGVRVLALHEESPAVITLEASEQDAIKLVAARQAGTLTAMLRRPDDTLSSAATVRPADLAALIGMEQPAAVQPAPARGPIPILYGNRLDSAASPTDTSLFDSDSALVPPIQDRMSSIKPAATRQESQ